MPMPPPPPLAAPSNMRERGMSKSSFGEQSAGRSQMSSYFDPLDVVVLGELDIEEQEAFIDFIVENDVNFFLDTDEMYTANVQFVQPIGGDGGGDDEGESGAGWKKLTPESAKRTSKEQRNESARLSSGKRMYRRMSRPPQEMHRVVGALSTANQLFDYSCYPKFSSLVTLRQNLRPRKRTLAWLMHTIEELYDQRYVHDTQELRDRELGVVVSNEERLSNQFPVFVVDHFSKLYGLRALVDQSCWDMLYNLHALRKHYLEVEIFARFTEEYYDDKDLLFFLYARSVIQKELRVSFKRRWSELGRGMARMPDPLPISRREAAMISRLIFGPDAKDLSAGLMQMFGEHCVGERGSARSGRDTRRVDVMQFLHLALVQYRTTKAAHDGEQSNVPEPDGHNRAAPPSPVYDQASKAFDQKMKDLAAAQETADEHIKSDHEKAMRVHEMENAIRKAMGVRDGSGGGDEEKISMWAQEMLSREQRAADTSPVRRPPGRVAESRAQQEALMRAQELERIVETKSKAVGSHHSGVDVTGLRSYLEEVEADRRAIESIEIAKRGSETPLRATTATSNSPVREAPELSIAEIDSGVYAMVLSEIDACMKKHYNDYLDILMQSCDELPNEVIGELRSEVQMQLHARGDVILNGVREEVASHRSSAAPPRTGLERQLWHILQKAYADKSVRDNPHTMKMIHRYCKSVLQTPELRQEIEPLVALLVTYAAARLNEQV